MSTWTAVLLTAIGCFALKAAGWAVPARVLSDDRVRRVAVLLPVALLAGLESIGGLLLAGIIVGVVQGLTSAYIDPLIGGNAAAVVPYIFMLVVLIVRPTGMFGWKRIERV
jgi:branched-subunit amino acid ABC-type transport system permease component